MDYTWLMPQRFGAEWETLSWPDQKLIASDFALLLSEEYDVPDDTMSEDIQEENAIEASREYRRRIGGGNLASYVKCLAAGAARKA
jgi:hypothetical protein